MRQKERKAAKHAAGTGKGRPTPKNTPGTMTRATYTRVQGRKARRELADAPAAARRAVAALRGARRSEQDALEHLLREAGAVDLSRLTKKGAK